MGFDDVSHIRRSEVWKSFLLDREKEQAQCKKCLAEKNLQKVFNIKNMNTKSLLNQLERAHSEKTKKPINSMKTLFDKKESIGELVSKLAIDGTSFRIISESETLQNTVGLKQSKTVRKNDWKIRQGFYT